MNEQDDDTFTSILIADVISAMKRRDEEDSQAARRDLIRSCFAAIEGLVWIFRQEVVETAHSTYGLEDDERLVFEEKQLFVTDQGKIVSQSRYLGLLPTIRLLARIANRINDASDFDFAGTEWNAFRNALTIRHRLTHPKSADDLVVNDSDVTETLRALFWFLDRQGASLASSLQAQKRYLGDFNEVLAKLKAGDPEITALYNSFSELDG